MIIKHVFISLFSVMLCSTTFAQNATPTIYYLKNSGKIVSTRDSADFYLFITPSNEKTDKVLYDIKEVYRNGAIRLMTRSSTNSTKLKFEGSYDAFFSNGQKMSTRNYENGELAGEATEYYPNGKLYCTRTLGKDRTVLYNECRDSTGKELTTKGNGHWIGFNNDFKNIATEGQVIDGFAEGEWHGKVNDTVDVINEYKKSLMVGGWNSYKSGKRVYFMVEKIPEFPGGVNGFYQFLSQNIVYPAAARKNGTQGRVIVSFICDKNGNLSDVKVVRGIGDGCDEEAQRVVKLSPPWKPGYQNGSPVNVAYSVPISYNLKGK